MKLKLSPLILGFILPLGQGAIASAEPPTEPITPTTCQEFLIEEMRSRGYPPNPEMGRVAEDVLRNTTSILNPSTGEIRVGWVWVAGTEEVGSVDAIAHQIEQPEGRELRAATVLVPALEEVEPNVYLRWDMAEDMARAIAVARLNPLCEQPPVKNDETL